MYLPDMNVTSRKQTRRRASTPAASLDKPVFLLGEVAEAAGITETVLKAWIARKVVPVGKFDIAAQGKGRARLFTLRRAISVAVTAELVRLGVTASQAALFALALTDYEPGAAELEKLANSDAILLAHPDREPFVVSRNSRDFTIRRELERGGGVSFVAVGLGPVADRVLGRLQKTGKLETGSVARVVGSEFG